MTNLDRFKKDLEDLIKEGNRLHLAIQAECFPTKTTEVIEREMGDKAEDVIKDLQSFKEKYQQWYSVAKALIAQLLPNRLDDFVRYYEKPKNRKEVTYENYKIEDYLQNLHVTRGYQKELIVGPDAAILCFRQQISIVMAAKSRFESSLFDIKQLAQSDLFDSELDTAAELAKKKFTRAAGAVAGVVLEKHLALVCDNHHLKISKKAPGIADLNNLLKENDVIDIPQWRHIQLLADIRNLCDHNKEAEPTIEQVNDLITGVAKTIKTLF